jgi:Tfp pilus assembly PilM family ATPase
VICTAVRRDHVELLLNAAEKARLDVAGLVAAPMALRDCFSRIYRRTSDVETGFCFVDIGRTATRVTIMRAGHLYFARSVSIGSEDLNKAVADAVGVQPSEARLLRSQLAEQQTQSEAPRPEPIRPAARPSTETDNSFAVLGAALKQKIEPRAEPAPAVETRTSLGAEAYVMRAPKAVQVTSPGKSTREGTSLVTEMSVAQAIDPVVHHLADEIQRCRRYHEGTFPGVPVDRLVFVGGEAHVRSLCQALARRLGIAAQLGDPIVGLCHDVSARRETPDLAVAGIDRRRPQPAWAVACGLSLGAPA